MAYDYYGWLADACLTGKYPYRAQVAQIYLARMQQERDQAYHLDEPDAPQADTMAINQEKCVLFMVFLDAMIESQYPDGVKENRILIISDVFLHFLPAFEPVSADCKRMVQRSGQGNLDAWHDCLMQVGRSRGFLLSGDWAVVCCGAA